MEERVVIFNAFFRRGRFYQNYSQNTLALFIYSVLFPPSLNTCFLFRNENRRDNGVFIVRRSA